jgi:hypothetical protein
MDLLMFSECFSLIARREKICYNMLKSAKAI